VDTTENSVSAEWMVSYLTSKIHHGGAIGAPDHVGTEIYEFDPTSGLSLWRATDMSGNVTNWEFGDAYGAMPKGLETASTTMTKWADPTAKIDARGRREEYTYNGSFRVMDGIDDPYATTTAFTVDGLGRRKSKQIHQGGSVLLRQERFDYNNQRFKAFQTGIVTQAYANVSSQDWETDQVTAYLPDTHGRLWRETIDPGGLNLTTEHAYDFNNNRTSTLDPRGNRTRFKYDKLNRLIEVTFPSAGTLGGEAVSTKQIWYDENGNKAAEIDEEGNTTIHHYDALNRLITTIRDMDGAGLPTRNADGLVTEANKGSVTGNDLVTRFAYNPVGALIRQTDPRGIVTRTFYDSIQRPIHIFTGLTNNGQNLVYRSRFALFYPDVQQYTVVKRFKLHCSLIRFNICKQISGRYCISHFLVPLSHHSFGHGVTQFRHVHYFCHIFNFFRISWSY
jgi:YD repeat-containing protein